MLVTGNQIGKALIDALQLPKHTRSFVLRVEVDRVVSVECEYYPEGDSFVTALAEYDLVRRTEPVPPPAMNFDAWMRDRTEASHAAYMARHSEGGKAYAKTNSVTINCGPASGNVDPRIVAVIRKEIHRHHAWHARPS